MSENLRISKKTIAFMLVGVLIAAFLGIVAGSYFFKVRSAEALKSDPVLRLRIGQYFPEFRFTGLVSGQPDLYQSLAGRKSVVIFLTTDCEDCVQAVSRWDSMYPSISHEYQVFGVSYETIDRMNAYRAGKGIKFPLYNDPNGKFTAEHHVEHFPTIVGINEKREIVFIGFSTRSEESVGNYLKLL
ncbi:MAG TPA: redoxin domain-containing protein [Verrucomicrobiae bacterium]|nr:redoxin domain-containing protein [Verrucomicrobiae bacterium]